MGLFRRRVDVVVLLWLTISLLNEAVLDSFAIRKFLLTNQSGYFSAGLLLYEMYLGRRDATEQWLFALAAACAVSQAIVNAKELQDRFGVIFDGWIVATICLAAILVVMFAVRVRRVPLPPSLILAIGGLTYSALFAASEHPISCIQTSGTFGSSRHPRRLDHRRRVMGNLEVYRAASPTDHEGCAYQSRCPTWNGR